LKLQRATDAGFPYSFPLHLFVVPLALWALTGVSSSGVEMGEQSPLSLMPLPRSKSQILTGDT
jgi:hypothetical protein